MKYAEGLRAKRWEVYVVYYVTYIVKYSDLLVAGISHNLSRWFVLANLLPANFTEKSILRNLWTVLRRDLSRELFEENTA